MKIGVDIGGTKVEAALVSAKGKIVKKVRKPIEANKGGKTALKNIYATIDLLIADRISSICLSTCGVIRKGKLIYSPNTPKLVGVDIVGLLHRRYGKKIIYDNDANCFALAEQRFGAAKGHENVVGVIIGTGLGSGIVVGGKVYSGNGGFAGEIGRNFISENDFENLCSGPAIVRRYKDAGGKIDNPDPKKIFSSREKAAKKVVDETYEHLARGFSMIINTLDPDIIVVGGGLSNLPIYRRLNKDVKKYSVRNCRIVRNKLGDSSGVIGATLL